jgi:hypothetical protein
VDLLDVKAMAPFYEDVRQLRGRVPEYSIASLEKKGAGWVVTIRRGSDRQTAAVSLDGQFRVSGASVGVATPTKSPVRD